MKIQSALILALALTAGCAHSQVPPTVHSVTITITPPSGASGAAYVISRATGSTCPGTTGASYTPLNQSAPTTGTSYVDTTAAGLSVCYIAQTVQGGAVSAPSNVAGPFVVPANPTAPSINGQSAKNDVPSVIMSSGTMANVKVVEYCAGGAPAHNAPDCIPLSRAGIFAAPMAKNDVPQIRAVVR